MAFDLPFRLRVLNAMTTCLKAITPEDDEYTYDLSDFEVDDEMFARVFRGRNWFGADDPLPMVSILEPPAPMEPAISPQSIVKQVSEWDLLVQGFVDDDKDNPTDPAYLLLADVKRALMLEKSRRRIASSRTPDIFGMGGFGDDAHAVIDMIIGSGTVRPPDEVSAKAYFWLTVTLRIKEDITMPFA